MRDIAIERQMSEGEEPLSPVARLFSLPGHDVFNMVTIGCKTKGDPSTVIEGLKNTLINHPRFSSILVTGHGEQKPKWIQTKVIVEDHVVIPEIDPNIEDPDKFLEDYTSNLAFSPMDKSKPLWEFHILILKTSHAESMAVARFHHSLGDGMSLMSLLLACTQKTSNPEALPTFVTPKKTKRNNICVSLVSWLWFKVLLMFYTCVEVIKSIVFLCCAKDTPGYLLGKPGATLCLNRFMHRVINLDDVKMVKNAMNMTVNDVLLGMVQAGLSRYLNQRYDQETSSKPSRKHLDELNLHGVVFFNLRPNRNIEDLANMMAKGSKCRWGNSIGYALIPLVMKPQDDVLEYFRQSKTIMDRKKHSLEPFFSYGLLKLTMEVFGFEALQTLINRVFGSTLMVFASLVGPSEEISFFGHPISYIGASSSGVPQAIAVCIQSYVNKLVINISYDEDVIPDPHHLCDLMIEALHMMKSSAPQKIFHASHVN